MRVNPNRAMPDRSTSFGRVAARMILGRPFKAGIKAKRMERVAWRRLNRTHTMSFQEEHVKFLQEHGIHYNERYVWG